nr:hypothetical protein [Tanacetum cinerariifolium]
DFGLDSIVEQPEIAGAQKQAVGAVGALGLAHVAGHGEAARERLRQRAAQQQALGREVAQIEALGEQRFLLGLLGRELGPKSGVGAVEIKRLPHQLVKGQQVGIFFLEANRTES